jgi:3',5'-cyclic AMP phosphodiesterase CpdA
MRIAHLSDLHLNGTFDRRARLIGALAQASKAGAKHLLLTGDLTGHGRLEEFRELAGLLAVNWCGGLTIVPGNHDGTSGNFEHVFGPVASPFDLDGQALVIPIDTRAPRRSLLFRALGKVGHRQISMLDWLTTDVQKPTIIVQHHGPQVHPLQVFDGLIDRAAIMRLLARSSNIHICCGHDHRVLDVGNQIHIAASCATHDDPLRLYDVGVDGFSVSYRSRFTGTTGVAGLPNG